MCPELGKASYVLILDSQQFDAGLAEADATATKITTSIGQKLGYIGTEAQAAGAEVGAAGAEMAGGFETAGGAAVAAGSEAKAGAAEMVSAARGAAAGTETAAAVSTTAWGKMGASVGAMGTKSFGIWKLAGLAAIYEVAKGGIHWLSDTNKYTLQLNNALRATHDVASTSTKEMLKFSDSSEALATEGGRSAVLQLQAMLLGFTNIRNEGPKAAAIFDRVRQAALDISTRTGRSLTTVAVALGKAFQDPVKYMNTLGRAGVTFNKQQQTVVANLIAANKPLQAQQFMLQLLSRYSGSAAKQAQSFAGQWRIARGELEHSSAQIVTAFIPAFKQIVGVLVAVAGFLSRHTTLVKDVTIAYLAWKGAALAVGIAMKLIKVGQIIGGFLGIGRAARTSATEVGALSTAEGTVGPAAAAGATEARLSFAAIGAGALAALGPVLLLVEALGMAYFIHKFGFKNAIQSGLNPTTSLGGDITDSHTITVKGKKYVLGSGQAFAALKKAGYKPPKGVNADNIGAAREIAAAKSVGGTADIKAPIYTPAERLKRKAAREQRRLRHALNSNDFSQSPSVVPGMGDQWTKLQIAYDKAQLTKGTADDKKALQNEESFLRTALKNRHLTLDQRKGILDQIVAIQGQLQALDTKTAKTANPSLDKLLGVKWKSLDIAEQKAKQSGNLGKDKKALQNEEDFLKQMLRNRKLSLESRRKIEHELTTVEDKIKAINRKMASNAKDSQTSEMEAFNELQGSFFGQFAPNIFGSSPKGLTLGSQHVRPHHRKVQHHAMGGVIHYASGGAVDTKYVREAPHYASHEARFHRAGMKYFEHNSPTREQRGSDTVPAMLTPGELVLNNNQQRRLRSKLGLSQGGSPEQLFDAITAPAGGGSGHGAELVMRLARHQIEMSRGGSRAPYRSDISTWLRQFSGMSKAQKSAAGDWWGTNYDEVRRGYASGGVAQHPDPLHVHHHHHHHHHQSTSPPLRSFVPPRGSISFIQREARRMGLDPRAVLGVASGEGLGGGIGDHGTSFGPWQLHKGGAYPRWAPQAMSAAQRWAWSHAGIEYALHKMAAVARGLHGRRAAMAIINRFERPANPMHDYNAYLTYVGSHGEGGRRMRQGRLAAPVGRNDVFERVDQGVDYLVKGAVHAVGAGRIAAITGGMAGGTGKIVKERLDHPITVNGHKYYGIYYSESSPMVHAGQRVRAGQAVMGGGGVEIGFLNSRMQLPPLRGGLGAGTKPSQAGYDFSVLISDIRSGKRTGMSPVGRGRKVVRRGSRWMAMPMSNTSITVDTGISGLVPGVVNPITRTAAVPSMDTVPAMLSPGEMVLNAQQQELLRRKLGLQALANPSQLFAAITNPQHFMHGGPVGHTRSGHVMHRSPPPPHVSASTAHHHPETQRYAPHYVPPPPPPHVSAATAYHHPETQAYGPRSHYQPVDHPSYHYVAQRYGPPFRLTNSQYRHYMNPRPDAGGGGIGGFFSSQFGPAFHAVARVGSGAASFGYNVAKSTALLANQAINPNNAGVDFIKANLALTLNGDPQPMLHWLTEGQGGKQGAGQQWKDFLTHPIMSYQKAAKGQYGRSSQMDAMYVSALTKGQYEFAKGAVTHPLRNPQNTALLLALLATPWMRRLGPALPEVNYGTQLRGAALNKALGIGLRMHGMRMHGGPKEPMDNRMGREAQDYLRVHAAFAKEGYDPFLYRRTVGSIAHNPRPPGFWRRLMDKNERAGHYTQGGDPYLLNKYGLHPEITGWSYRHGVVRRPPGGLGIVGGPRSPRDVLAQEAQSYLGVVDFFRGQGYGPFGIRSSGPFGESDATSFQAAAGHEIAGYAAMARDVARTLPPSEWPNWVRNQLRKQGLLEKFLRRGQHGIGGLGIVGTKREAASIWNRTMKTRALAGNTGLWGVPEASLWRGGDPLSAIQYTANLAHTYPQFGSWYDAMGLTMSEAGRLEKTLSPDQLAAVKALTSYRNYVPSNLKLGIDASRFARGRPLTTEALRGMSPGLSYKAQVGRINQLIREGAVGIGHKKLGLAGDIQFGGPKVPSYFHNIMHSVFPDRYSADAVTIDTIAADALVPGIQGMTGGLDPHYNTLAEIYRQIGRRYGMSGKETQASVWVPHRVHMRSVARGGAGDLFNAEHASVLDWLPAFGSRYGRRAQERLARMIANHGYGGLGIVSHSKTPLSKSWDTGVSAILHDWSGEGALNAGVFHVAFGDETEGVVKFLGGALGNPRDKLANEILQARVAHAVGAYVPDMMPLGDSAFAMRAVEGATGHGESRAVLDEIYKSRAGHRLGILDTLIGNADRHGFNFKISDFGPVGYDADLLWRGAGSPFERGFESNMMTEYDYHYLDHALPRLKPIFAKLGRNSEYSFLLDQWKNFKQNRAGLRGHGDPLTLLKPTELAPYYSGRVFPGIMNPDLEQVRSLAREYRQAHGIRGRNRGDYISGYESESELHDPPPGYRWDAADGMYRHTSGWTWRDGQGFEPVNGKYVRRSQVTPPFTAGNRQIFGMGQNTRDIFHGLIDRFPLGDPNRHLAEQAYKAMKIYPKGAGHHFAPSMPRGFNAGYHGAMDVLGNIFGVDVPRDLFPEGEGMDARRRGLSGLMQHLHDLYHYPFNDDRFRQHFSVGGAVSGSGKGDTVSAMLTPGEIVLNSAQQVLLRQRLGLQSMGSPQQLFNEIAARHYATGGIVEGLDLGNIGVPSPYTTSTPSLGYQQRKDIARLVGIEIRAREIDTQSPTGTLHYEQHNSYHELPKDKFAEARQMKQAVHATFLT